MAETTGRGASYEAPRLCVCCGWRRSFSQTARTFKGYDEGIITPVGAMTGGFTMFLKGGRLYHDDNYKGLPSQIK